MRKHSGICLIVECGSRDWQTSLLQDDRNHQQKCEQPLGVLNMDFKYVLNMINLIYLFKLVFYTNKHT